MVSTLDPLHKFSILKDTSQIPLISQDVLRTYIIVLHQKNQVLQH